jgi:DEAD/DEAH box helicase domain-containing protein
MHTTAFWLTLPEALGAELGLGRAAAIEGVRGIAVALETVSTLALMCDPRDLGQTLGDGGDNEEDPWHSEPGGQRLGVVPREKAPAVGSRVPRMGFDPTIFLFDNVPGGVGLSERIYQSCGELLARSRALIANCACVSGCPFCVGATEAVGAPGRPGGVRRRAALALLQRVVTEAVTETETGKE